MRTDTETIHLEKKPGSTLAATKHVAKIATIVLLLAATLVVILVAS